MCFAKLMVFLLLAASSIAAALASESVVSAKLTALNSALAKLQELNEVLAAAREDVLADEGPVARGFAEENGDTVGKQPSALVHKLRPHAIAFYSGMNKRWTGDIFPGFDDDDEEDDDEEDDDDEDDRKTLFESADPVEWAVLCSVTVALIVLDFTVVQKIPSSSDSHAKILMFWVAVAMAYNAYFWIRNGNEDGIDWCSGYFLEWLLSMDNIFVFHLIFKAYNTPEDQLHKALFFGIFGAVVFRMAFFMAAGSLLDAFDWVRFVFGAFLIYSGYTTAMYDDDDDEDVENTFVVRGLKKCLGGRLLETYADDGSFFVRDDEGRLRVTLLMFIVMMCEASDIMFAVDSVSAKVGQIRDQYIAYSSSVLAMFGLRAMFFVIKDLCDYFEMLKYGLSFILIFIGLELMFSHWIHLSSATVCFVILLVFIGCIGVSHLRRNREEGDESEAKIGEDVSIEKKNVEDSACSSSNEVKGS
eukprot:gnl/TRDRNA2_/TRDRNA2_86130_c0_seq3.p1 gnl/TRDRNA2_/TRDRNA2_86130_c0~~gnl/TRDRNA2_/TRDRNA2_86130_c0_seq3.p1  ORF type:complete len:473 (-),score=122.14 gnl/TRDRNA2_/TRDRNA2_86130_c0_seq3:131-1549(-)